MAENKQQQNKRKLDQVKLDTNDNKDTELTEDVKTKLQRLRDKRDIIRDDIEMTTSNHVTIMTMIDSVCSTVRSIHHHHHVNGERRFLEDRRYIYGHMDHLKKIVKNEYEDEMTGSRKKEANLTHAIDDIIGKEEAQLSDSAEY